MTGRATLDALDCLVPAVVRRAPTGSGALDDCRFVAKDLFAVAGHRTSFGMARWRDTHDTSSSTAPAVERLLAAGAELVGMGKLDALAYSLVGNAGEGPAPRNSIFPDRFTGGSTSGPAAAVAGGLVDLGLGSDTAGSIRVPAAACGLWSIRPTHGAIDVDGMLALAPSFDSVALVASSARLLRDAYEVLAAVEGSADPRMPREVLVAADTLEWIESDAANAIARGASAMARVLGCPMSPVDLRGFTSIQVAETFTRLQGRELWARYGAWVDDNLDAFLPEVRARLERARAVATAPDARDVDARDREYARRLRGALNQLIGPGSLVVVPVLHDLPPRRDAGDADLVAFRSAALRLTAPASLAGMPEVVVPVRHERSGNSYGIGLLGAPGADRALLDAAVRIGALAV